MSAQPNIETEANEPTAWTVQAIAKIRDNEHTLPLPYRGRLVRAAKSSPRISRA